MYAKVSAKVHLPPVERLAVYAKDAHIVYHCNRDHGAQNYEQFFECFAQFFALPDSPNFAIIPPESKDRNVPNVWKRISII